MFYQGSIRDLACRSVRIRSYSLVFRLSGFGNTRIRIDACVRARLAAHSHSPGSCRLAVGKTESSSESSESFSLWQPLRMVA